MPHHVTTVFNQGMSFTAQIDQHRIEMDSHEDSRHDTGPGPKKLMLAALAGCTGIDVVSILEKMKVGFTEFSIDTSASLTDEHPRIYDRVKITYKIKLAQKDRSKMEKAVQLSADKYCGVSAMFKAFSKVESEIDYL